METIRSSATRLGVLMVFALGTACAQTPAMPESTPAEPKAPGATLAPLAWLEGCWRGTVNQREYREQWMPLRGNLIVGVSQTVAQDKTLGFEYLRLESRPEGIFYIASPSGKKEDAFRLAEQTIDRSGDRNDQLFVFVNPALDFPQKITYRRASDGWLYADVEGKAGSADRKVIYPMRRIDCESGELLLR
jgi:Domain of unknown function (DUF6265)